MKKIFKYKLDNINTKGHMILEIPMPAEIISTIESNNEAVVYAIVDDEDHTTPVDILAIETGMTIKDDMDTYKFVGTVVLDKGECVIHIFYRYIDILGTSEFGVSKTIKESAGKTLQEIDMRSGLLIT